MATKNFYTQFEEIPYKRTTIDMTSVITYAKSLFGYYPKEVIKLAYCIFRNESANGKSGVCNNYGGIQADNAVWQGLNLDNVVGTCVKIDGAGDTRRFICFNENGYKTCFEFICYKVNQRGMFIGASNVNDADDLYNIYQKKWVANPKENTDQARRDFKSLYSSSITFIG